MKNLVLVLFALVVGVGCAAFRDVEIVNAQNPTAALVQGKCSKCHDLARVKRNLGKRDAAEWKSTVARMKSKGAEITDAEVGTISEFLGGLKDEKGL